jgi:hypothetical protein
VRRPRRLQSRKGRPMSAFPVYNDALALAAFHEHVAPLLPPVVVVAVSELMTRMELDRIRAHNARSAIQPGWPITRVAEQRLFAEPEARS